MARATTYDAYMQIRPHISQLARKVYDSLLTKPNTCQGVQKLLNMHVATCSARITELADKGWIVNSGVKGYTESGRRAVIWKVRGDVATPAEPSPPEHVVRPRTDLNMDILGRLRQGPATCQEIEDSIGRPHQAVSGNLAHLIEDGHVEDTGCRRKTRSGRDATVWRIA